MKVELPRGQILDPIPARPLDGLRRESARLAGEPEAGLRLAALATAGRRMAAEMGFVAPTAAGLAVFVQALIAAWEEQGWDR